MPKNELNLLREAVDNVDQGVVIIDQAMRVCFVNSKARAMWRLHDVHCDGRPLFSDFLFNIAAGGAYAIEANELTSYVLRRFETVEHGDSTPVDIRLRDGRVIRAQVTPLPSGGRMVTHTDVTDLILQADHYRQLANVDSLTGLPNRREFLARAHAEWDRFSRYNVRFSIAVLDIDRFKRINDDFGHDVGDRAIVHVASILQQGKRASDVVARLGGDEYAILTPNTAAADALPLAERLRRSLADSPLYEGARPVDLTISIGIAEIDEAATSVESVIKSADTRLYAAKLMGRNSCRASDVHGATLS